MRLSMLLAHAPAHSWLRLVASPASVLLQRSQRAKSEGSSSEHHVRGGDLSALAAERLLHETESTSVLLLVDAARVLAPRADELHLLCWAWRHAFPQLPEELIRQIARWLPPGLLSDECESLAPMLEGLAERHGPGSFQASVVLCNFDGLIARAEGCREHPAIWRAISERIQQDRSRSTRPNSSSRGKPWLDTGDVEMRRLSDDSALAIASQLRGLATRKLRVSLEWARAAAAERAAALSRRAGTDFALVTAPQSFVMCAPELDLRLLSPSASKGLSRTYGLRRAAVGKASQAATAARNASVPLTHEHGPESLAAVVVGALVPMPIWFAQQGFFEDLARLVAVGRPYYGVGWAWSDRTPGPTIFIFE
jgi:hypothetical protein